MYFLLVLLVALAAVVGLGLYGWGDVLRNPRRNLPDFRPLPPSKRPSSFSDTRHERAAVSENAVRGY